MITVSRIDIGNILRIELLAQLRTIQDKIGWFEQKYHCSFEEFGEVVESGEEIFEQWDDYMEWQAYQKAKTSIQHLEREIS